MGRIIACGQDPSQQFHPSPGQPPARRADNAGAMTVNAPSPRPAESRADARGDARASGSSRAPGARPQTPSAEAGAFALLLARGRAPGRPTATCDSGSSQGVANPGSTETRGEPSEPNAGRERAPEPGSPPPCGSAAGAPAGPLDARGPLGQAVGGPPAAAAALAGGGVAAVQGIERLVRAAAVSEVRGNSTLRLRLDGGRLGPIEVALRMRGGRLCTVLGLERASEYTLVRGALPQLEHALRERGLAIAPVEVQVGASPERQRDGGGGGAHTAEQGRAVAEDPVAPTGGSGARRAESLPRRSPRRSPTDYVA